MPQPAIALVMIVRDEAETLQRCLDSVRDHVDRLIVLDTGSRDATRAIARAAGADVFEMPWTHDFAAARNAALALSDADWNLVLDADEWLLEGGQHLREVVSRPDGPFIGRLPIVSLIDHDDRREIVTTALSRLLPRGVRYVGGLHEQPLSDLPRQLLPVMVGHDGYEAALLARRQARADRSPAQTSSVETYVETSVADLHFHVGQACEVAGEWRHALMHYRDALEGAGAEDAESHGLLLATLGLLKRCGETAQALMLVNAHLARWQDSPDVLFLLGELLLDHAATIAITDPDAAVRDILPLVETAWRQCLEIGENPFLDGAEAGRGSWRAAQHLAALYASLARDDEARRYGDMALRMVA